MKATNEVFDPSHTRLNSVKKLVRYTDSLYGSSSIAKGDTERYVLTVSGAVRNRFFQGTLDYRISDNWIAYLGGKLLWSHLSSIVIPDDIFKHSQGLCSQQTIAFMSCLRDKGITVRSIGLGYDEGPGHFICEVRYDNDWHVYDVSFEPKWQYIKDHHKNIEYYIQNKDSLFAIYENKIARRTFDRILERVRYGKVNEIPAPHMRLFHAVTHKITFVLPVLFIFLFISASRKNKKHLHLVKTKPKTKLKNMSA